MSLDVLDVILLVKDGKVNKEEMLVELVVSELVVLSVRWWSLEGSSSSKLSSVSSSSSPAYGVLSLLLLDEMEAVDCIRRPLRILDNGLAGRSIEYKAKSPKAAAEGW